MHPSRHDIFLFLVVTLTLTCWVTNAQTQGTSTTTTTTSDKLTFDSKTGIHSGTFAGVQLPSKTGPSAAPLLGTVGYSTDKKLIYGPFEAGFGTTPTATSSTSGRPPYPCNDGGTYSGYCPGGMDVGTCEETLFKTCKEGTVTTALFMDKCGGHATPYHYHTDMVCHYDPQAAGHSTLVGIMLDGRNLYGRHETTGVRQRRPKPNIFYHWLATSVKYLRKHMYVNPWG